MAYVVELNFGAGWVDISASLHGRIPVTRSRAVHNKLAPTISTARFTITNNAALVAQILSQAADIRVRIYKDAVPYFAGSVRPTHTATASRTRLDYQTIECVDDWYLLDSYLTGAPMIIRSGYVCDPANTPQSILHRLFNAAGIDTSPRLAALPSIPVGIASFIVDTTASDEIKIRDLVEALLREVGYTAYVDGEGNFHLYDLGPSAITPSKTLSTGNGGTVAEKISIIRKEQDIEAVDVSYYPPKTLSAQVIFEDTTGADDTSSANIPVDAGGYFPQGATAVKTVDAEYKLADYRILEVISPSLIVEANPAMQVQSAVYKPSRATLRLYAPNATTITKFRIVSDVLVAADKDKAVWESVANSRKRERLELKYVSDETSALRLAAVRGGWYLHGEYTYEFKCSDLTLNIGDYCLLNDDILIGFETLVRIVSIDNTEDEKTITVTAEGVGPFEATAVLGDKTVKSVSTPEGYLQDATITLETTIHDMASDGLITPQEKVLVYQQWGGIQGDGSTTGMYWPTRLSCLELGVNTVDLDAAYNALYAYLFTTPGVIAPATWADIIVIDNIEFSELWGSFSRQYTQTLVNLSFYQANIGYSEIDCGMYDPGITPDAFPDLDFLMWDGSYLPAVYYDCGMLLE